MSSLNSTRNATRVQAPPVGHSSISFGGGELPMSPSKAVPAPIPEPEPAVQPAVQPAAVQPAVAGVAEVTEVEPAAPEDDSPPLVMLKRQAIGAIAAAADAPDVRENLQLQVASAQQAKPAPTDAAPTDVDPAALKTAVKLQGTHEIIKFGKKVRCMDDDGYRKLGGAEVPQTAHERDAAVRCRWVGGWGAVQGAGEVLDICGDGKVTLAALERRSDASRHPDVITGTKSQRMVLLEFLDEGGCANTTCKRVLVFEDDAQ